MIASVASVASIATDPAPDLRAQIETEIERRKTTQAQAAREMGIHKTRLNQWLHGDYPGNNDLIDQAAATWLQAQAPKRAPALQPISEQGPAPQPVAGKPSGYLDTRTGSAITTHLKWAHQHKVLVVIYGDAGVGKTMACEHYAAEHKASWPWDGAYHVTMTSTIGSPRALLHRLTQKIGFHEAEIPRETALFHDSVIEHLRETDGLLILDEAQHLQPKELEVIRGIYDAAGIGIALVGNEYSYSRFNRGRREQYSQLVSRFDLILHLAGVKNGDVEAIAAAWGVTNKRTLTSLSKVADRPGAGALRRVHKVLNMAYEIAAKSGTAITHEHVESAVTRYI